MPKKKTSYISGGINDLKASLSLLARQLHKQKLSSILESIANINMTFEDFQIKVKRKTGFDRYWYYGLCLFTITLSLVLLYFIITYPEKFTGSPVLHYSGFAFLFLLGSYGLYVLPNRYKIIIVDSGLAVDKKRNVISKLLQEYEALKSVDNERYFYFTLRKRFWNTPYNVHLFYDEEKFAFSVQGNDTDGGFIDLGGTQKKRKEITRKIEEFVAEEIA